VYQITSPLRPHEPITIERKILSDHDLKNRIESIREKGVSKTTLNYYLQSLITWFHIIKNPQRKYRTPTLSELSNNLKNDDAISLTRQRVEKLVHVEGDLTFLTEITSIMETMLADRGVTKDDLNKEIYTQRNAKIINVLEKQIAEGKLTPEQTNLSLDVLKLSWEEYKKHRLDTEQFLKSIGR
jgi:hypothetical protein